jgi:uncharacterized protein YybS (DUF2232 family)
MFWSYYLLFVSICSALSWFVADFLARRTRQRNSILKSAFAGIVPTLLIVLGLAVWDHFAWQEYLKGPRDGYMSPLVGLIYGGFHLFGNLVCNLASAFWRRRLP